MFIKSALMSFFADWKDIEPNFPREQIPRCCGLNFHQQGIDFICNTAFFRSHPVCFPASSMLESSEYVFGASLVDLYSRI